MTIKPEEITNIIKERISNFETRLQVDEVGTVLTVGDGVARVSGLENVMSSELVELPNGVFGMALNLEEDNVGVVLLGPAKEIKEGSTVKRTEKIVSVPIGDALLGRTVNSIGEPIDGNGEIKTDKTSGGLWCGKDYKKEYVILN